ncbi:MAG: EMC3/TMCO1 family protein [Candidatus Helarchaeota archaeon]
MQTKYKVLIGIAAIIAVFVIFFFVIGNNYLVETFWIPVVQKNIKENFLFSFFSIILISFCLSLSTNLLTKKVTDLPRLHRYQAEIDKWKKQEKEAKRLAEEGIPNKKLMIKVQRKKKYIEKIQRSMATERMKPSIFTFVPYIILFTILSRYVFGWAPTAIFPFNLGKVPILNTFFVMLGDLGHPLPGGIILYYYGWYSICLFTFNLILQRFLGTRLQ